MTKSVLKGESTIVSASDEGVSPTLCRNCGASVPEGSTACLKCPDSFPPPDSKPASLPAIAGYKVLRCYGAGGMGAVYLAEDLTLGRLVAIKFMSEKFAGDATRHARFLREARAMAHVEHPHIVRVYAFGEASGQHYIVMEFVEGENLAQLIRRRGRLPADEALPILRRIVEALKAAWEEKKIIHRDIKPSNILFDKRGQVRVADFGLAKALTTEGDATLTQEGWAVGTPHYIPPEQTNGDPVDFRGDIYALGIVLFEILVGERPFKGENPLAILSQHLHKPFPSLEDHCPDSLPGVARLVEWMTQKAPDLRPSSYDELLKTIDDLHEIPTGDSAAISSAPMVVQEEKRKQRNPLRVAAITAGVLALLLAASLFGIHWMNRPLELEAHMQAERVLPDGTTAPVEVDGNTVLQGGDSFWIDGIATDRKAYVYVYLLSSSGQFDQLFPAGETVPPRLPLKSGQRYRIPAESNWELDNNAGSETVFVVGSRNPIPEPEMVNLLARSNKRVTGAASDNTAPVLRGVSGFVPRSSNRIEQEKRIEQLLKDSFPIVRRYGFLHR